jgi:tetratricopeptide (TPR) repeat protein
MSRFSNLEFGGPQKREATGTPLKGEAFYEAEATEAFESGRFEVALRQYGKMLEHNPKSAVAWKGQVRMLIEMGEYREARVWADKAIELFPTDPELLAAKAVALGRSGDVQAALAYSDAAMEMQGETPYLWLARGDVLLARKEKRAEHCFLKALAAAPASWILHWLAARIHHHYERFATALKYAQKALELESTRAVLWLQAGLGQQQLGLLGAAETSFHHALELDSQCGDAQQALLELGRANVMDRIGGWWRKTFGP